MNTLFVRTFISWLPFLVAVTLVSGLVYVAVQQSYRSNANDPQVQLAEDFASLVAAGNEPSKLIPEGKIPIERSLAAYILFYDKAEKPIVGTGVLHDAPPVFPAGMLAAAKATGESRVTWQPEAGVRQALVVAAIPNDGGYVVVGRSLRESEDRTAELTQILFAGWLVALASTFLACALAVYLRHDYRS